MQLKITFPEAYLDRLAVSSQEVPTSEVVEKKSCDIAVLVCSALDKAYPKGVEPYIVASAMSAIALGFLCSSGLSLKDAQEYLKAFVDCTPFPTQVTLQ